MLVRAAVEGQCCSQCEVAVAAWSETDHRLGEKALKPVDCVYAYSPLPPAVPRFKQPINRGRLRVICPWIRKISTQQG